MRKYQQDQIEKTREALSRIWSTTVVGLGFVFGLAIARLAFWPPQVRDGEFIPLTGIFKLIAVLMVGYLLYLIWLYVIEPFLTVHRNFKERAARKNALRIVFRNGAICAIGMGCPTAFVIAIELPQPWAVVPLLSIWLTYDVLTRFRGATISAAVAPLAVND